MRTLLKVKMDVEAANKAIADGTLPKIIDNAVENLRPEACYFLAEDGRRTACFFFDLKDTADIPRIAEPFFSKVKAEVSFIPVMNFDDLKKGIQMAQESGRSESKR